MNASDWLGRFRVDMGLHKKILKPLRYVYLVRVVVCWFFLALMISATSLPDYDYNKGALLFVTIAFLCYPHIAFLVHLYRKDLTRPEHYEKIEFKTVYMDNFMCGFGIPMAYFYPPAVFVLTTGAFANLMTMGGFKLLLKGIIWLPLGILVSMYINGIQFYFGIDSKMLLFTASTLFVHFGSIVYLNYLNFNRMMKSKLKLNDAYAALESEKQRSEELLLNILPAEIAKELIVNGEAEARNHDTVSILFTDFKEFTQASTKLNAKDLVSEIDTYFKAFDKICETYGIEKIKTIGDSYMAAGGLLVTNHDSATNTVLAALAMSDFVTRRKKTRDDSGEISFQMRSGVHTGPVVAGIVGIKKFQYDIWGDTVNIASRMESAGEVGKLNISQSTYELIKDNPQFLFESRGKVPVKGKGEVAMWFVTAKDIL